MKTLPNLEDWKIIIMPDIHADWVGDWNKDTKTIYVHPALPKWSRISVGIHETIEMLVTSLCGGLDCCKESYDQAADGHINKLAHDLAEWVEHKVLGLAGYSFEEHQKLCKELSEKRKKEVSNGDIRI